MPEPVNPAGFPPNLVYSQGMIAPAGARTLYISGQVGVGPDGRPGADIGEQARLAVGNLNAVLGAAGMSAANLVKMTIYLTEAADIAGFMDAAAGALPDPPPATTLLLVKGLIAPELRVEIEGIAVG